MSQAAFFSDDAQQRTSKTIERIEKTTGAEVVVALRYSSGHYRDADYLFGFICALVALCALLFLPQPFLIDTWPLEITLAFALGAAFSANFEPLRRLLTSGSLMDKFVGRAARAHFMDAGLGATRQRTAVLVYVSMFERRVEVVTDIGVASLNKKAAFNKAVAELSEAVQQERFEDFLSALLQLQPPLAKVAPRRVDDINELPNDMVVV